VSTFERSEPASRAAGFRDTVTPVDDALVEEVRKRRAELGAAAPRIGLFVFDCAETSVLERVLARIPESSAVWFDEIVIVQERGAAERRPVPREWFARGPGNLRVHRLPRDAGFGGARKAAFEYALRKGFDHVVFMRGDGIHPPEELPALVRPILDDPAQMVFAYRLLRLPDTPGSWRLIPNLVAHTLATGFQNRLLGLRLRDYHSGFRLYSMRAVERVPYQLNSDDHQFDMQLVIQCRVLGVPVREVPVGPLWREYATNAAGAFEVLRASRCAIDYRLHQLHLLRLGNYFVDEGVRYTFKHSETGSHMQIVHAIAPGSRVLDLGCSQGLLAKPLREKGVRVTGVDIAPQAGAANDLEQYFQRDLDRELELPFGREFDYVVVSDVIEHLRNRTELLRRARTFLKEGGRLIISTPNIALWFYRLSLLVGRFEYGPRGVLDETHVHLFTRATFRREVEKAGFYVLTERVTALPFEIVFESTGRSRLVRSLNRSYHTLARIWPTMFAYQHILEAEITTLDDESGPVGEPAPGSMEQ
jgi:methionine biosynthesis protein MetW